MKYLISMPITGVITEEVEANSEQEAIDKAFDQATLVNLDGWELHEQIVKGNVFYGVQNEIEVYEEDEE